MATRKAKVKASEDQSQVRALIPRDSETQYLGSEPLFVEQPQPESRNSALARALMWYHRFYGRKEARDMFANYLDFHGRAADAKVMRKVAETEFMQPTFAWLSRITLRGLELTEHEMMKMENEITRLIETISKPSVKDLSKFAATAKTPEHVANVKANIQVVMLEKAQDAAAELEGLLDDYVLAGLPTKHTLRPIDEVSKKNVLPQHISIISAIWEDKLAEMNNVIAGDDSQLVQGYSFLSKQQVKNMIKFIELVLSDLSSYISVKKTAKAPRARKAVPVEKQVAKLKYLKTFKDAAAKIDLVSVTPVKLHGASEAWVYDSAKRRLHHFIADEYAKTFTVKGSTLLGFDTGKSESKTLRKPGEQLKEIMGSKPAARKFFDSIKAVATAPSGRFNADMVILKAF